MTSRSGSRLQVIIWLGASAVCGAVLSLAGAYLYLNPQIPSAESFRHVRLETPLRVYTEDRVLMGEFGERRVVPITLEQVPPLFIRALIDTEDKRFYEHHGIDFISFLNDAFDLAVHQEIRGGFSTITMQLARNVSLGLEQTFIRKFKEMLLALKIERELTKDQILELYVNFVSFGKRAYGAEAAALTYYGKHLLDLDLAELAMLAGIPQAPSAGNPINGPERALKRRNLVLTRMFEQGSIDAAQLQAALDAPNTARVHDPEVAANAPYAAEWVRRLVLERFGREAYTGGFEAITTVDSTKQLAATLAVRDNLLRYDRRHGFRGPEGHVDLPADATKAQLVQVLMPYPPRAGLDSAIVTTVDEKGFHAVTDQGTDVDVAFDLMRWARPFIDADTRGAIPAAPSDVVKAGDIVRVRQTDEGWALAQMPAIQGALVALDPDTGAVRSLVGGFDFSSSQFNHALQAARQPGSGFKPFVYSAALAQGVTPASMFLDAPLVFEDENLESTYRPKNVEGDYNGPTRLREALYKSINLVSMRVLLQVGAGNVLAHVARFGFDTSNFPRNTQLAVGGGTIAITPLQMAVAYAVFANGGFLIEPNILKEVRSLSGDVLFEAVHPVVCRTCEETIEPAIIASGRDPVAFQVSDVAVPSSSPATPPASDQPVWAKRVLDAGNAFIIDSMLQDVVRRGTGTKAKVLGRGDLAGKTGTTNEADVWFNGYQRHLVASVWVGFSDHSKVGDNEFGSGTPLPIWIDYMRVALAGVPEESPELPQGVVTMKIDPHTGIAARADQGDAVFEYFLAGHLPSAGTTQQTDSTSGGETAVKPVDIF